MPPRRRAVVWLLLTTAAWGLSFPCGKALLAAMEQALPMRNPWFYSSLMIGARFALGAAILWLAQPRVFIRLTAGEWRQGLGLGFAGGCGMLLQADGLAFTEASTSAFLTQFAAVLVPIIVAIRDRRLPSSFVLMCLAMVIAGVGVLAQFDWRKFHLGRGELETLLGTAFFAGQILWLERPIFHGNHTGRVTFVMFLTIAVLLSPVIVLNSEHPLDFAVLTLRPEIAILFVSVTLCCSVLAFLLMNRWQPAVDATTAGIIYCAEPVFATAFALFLPGLLAIWMDLEYANETATAALLAGGSLITLANILIALRPGAPPSENPAR